MYTVRIVWARAGKEWPRKGPWAGLTWMRTELFHFFIHWLLGQERTNYPKVAIAFSSQPHFILSICLLSTTVFPSKMYKLKLRKQKECWGKRGRGGEGLAPPSFLCWDQSQRFDWEASWPLSSPLHLSGNGIAACPFPFLFWAAGQFQGGASSYF